MKIKFYLIIEATIILFNVMRNIIKKLLFCFISGLFLVSCSNDTLKPDIFLINKELTIGDSKKNIIGIISDFKIDQKGNIYILDSGFKRIDKFNKDGVLIKVFGFGEGRGPGEFIAPHALDIDRLGNIYVVDKILRNITVFDSLNNVIYTQKLKFMPAQILVSASKIVYSSGFLHSYDGDIIYKYNFNNPSNYFVKSFCKRLTSSNSLTIEMSGNSGRLFKDNNNNVYFSFSYPYEIRKYNPDGVIVKTYKESPSFFSDPYFDSEKKYVVSNSGCYETFFLNDSLLFNLIYRKSGEQIDYYWDIINFDNLKNIGRINIKKVGLDSVRFIRSDLNGNIYLDRLSPYPHIDKYSLKIKK